MNPKKFPSACGMGYEYRMLRDLVSRLATDDISATGVLVKVLNETLIWDRRIKADRQSIAIFWAIIDRLVAGEFAEYVVRMDQYRVSFERIDLLFGIKE